MKKKAIFLDRDGTINIDKHYMYKIEDFEFVDGAVEGLKILNEMGYILIVVTNQGGIGRGLFSEEDTEKLNNFMVEELYKKGIEIKKCYYCPHHPEKGLGKYKVDCSCRKPNPGMILQGAEEFDIDLENSYMIGDKFIDAQAGLNAGVKPIIVKTGKEITQEILDSNIPVYSTIYEFAKFLLKKSENMCKK